nr:hypothetical protein [Tanacetum cinerariifolium]
MQHTITSSQIHYEPNPHLEVVRRDEFAGACTTISKQPKQKPSHIKKTRAYTGINVQYHGGSNVTFDTSFSFEADFGVRRFLSGEHGLSELRHG